MRLFDFFDQIRIINLPERTDRRRDMMWELRRIGLEHDPRVSFFEAVRPSERGAFTSIGARGVFESQKTILADAARANASVLILEDDCMFSPEAAAYEHVADWDIFYGGYYASDTGDLQGSNIIGAHMMGFSQRGAKLLTAYLDQLICDGIHPPIDAVYVWYRRAHPETRTAFAVPSLAFQRRSRSDIAPLPVYDRLPVLRSLASLIRSAIG